MDTVSRISLGNTTPCSVCENVYATKFCETCDTFLCQPCGTKHRRLSVKNRHTLVPVGKHQPEEQLCMPTQRCKQHNGNIIEFYCPDHDDVGCSSCMTLDHSKCDERQYVPDVAGDIKESQAFSELPNDLMKLKEKLNQEEAQKRNRITSLNGEKDVILEQLHPLQEHMTNQLIEMTEELENEIIENFKVKTDMITTDINEAKPMVNALENYLKQLNGDNYSDVFVTFKLARRDIVENIEPALKALEEVLPERSLELCVDEALKANAKYMIPFATLHEKVELSTFSANCDKIQNVKTEEDKHPCVIRSMCSLDDGSIIMTDICNKNLKKFDQISGKVSIIICFTDNPVGLCSIDTNTLAVSLLNEKKIQFVSLGELVTLDDSFTVGDRCRGLAYCDGMIYVCCGGNPEQKEGRGRVEVYNKDGNLLLHLYDKIAYPKYIAVTRVGRTTRIFVSDETYGVTLRKQDGQVGRTISISPGRLPFCLIGYNHICIGASGVNFSKFYWQCLQGKHADVKVRELDEKQLMAVHFDDNSSHLFVAFQSSDVVRVFRV